MTTPDPVPGSADRSDLLSLQGVALRYRGNPRFRLQSINLFLREGDFLGLVGPNGSGKSTLLKAMLGLIRPENGRVRWQDPLLRKGYVPQSEKVDPAWPMRVRDLLTHTLALLDPPCFRPRSQTGTLEEVMVRTQVVHLADQTLDTLSAGELQRVLLARALAVRPEVLFLDEPTASMDLVAAEGFLRLLDQVRREMPMSVVLITHDLNLLLGRASHLALIARERVIAGPVDAILREETLSSAFGEPIRVLRDHGRIQVLPGGKGEEGTP